MWRLQWAYADPDTRKRTSTDRYFPLKRDAEAWRDGKKVELRTGARAAEPSRRALTLQAWFDQLAGSKEEDFIDGKWVADGAAPRRSA